MNQQLIAYIKQQLAANEPRENIMNVLLAQGWKKSDLDEAFGQVEGVKTVPPAPPPPAATPFAPLCNQPSVSEQKSEQKNEKTETAAEIPSSKNFFQAQTPQTGFLDDQLNEVGEEQNSFKNIAAIAGVVLAFAGLSSWIWPWVGIAPIIIAAVLLAIAMTGSKKIIAGAGILICVAGLAGFAIKLSTAQAPLPDENTPGKEQTEPDGQKPSDQQPDNQEPEDSGKKPVVSEGDILESVPYADPKGVYTINAPKGWQAGQGNNNGRAFIIFLSPYSEKDRNGQVIFNENINITSETNKESSNDAYIAKSKAALQKYLTNYKVTEEQSVTIGGQQGKVVGGSFTQNGLQLRSLQLFAFKGNTAYVITGLAMSAKWDKESAAISSSLASFKLK